MTETSTKAPYPEGLLDWAGSQAGGVRRLFDDHSGRPTKVVLHTNLLARLERWAAEIAEGSSLAPRIVLLVGGPGNGKTEAVEHTIRHLDRKLGCDGQLASALRKSFFPSEGETVPRIVRIDAGALAAPPTPHKLAIVQDASVVAGQEGLSAAELLIDELTSILGDVPASLYLGCVNRGILDDALIRSQERDLPSARALLESITRAVSLSPDSPSCWPLDGYGEIAVWPMDAESLLVETDEGREAPAATLLKQALDEAKWPAEGACAAGGRCPFCANRVMLGRDLARESLLTMLRWYELQSGKRWSFRDLFSLISYLLAGAPLTGNGKPLAPCDWAARLAALDNAAVAGGKPTKQQSTAVFLLAMSCYQQALFHHWDTAATASLLKDLKELELTGDNTAMGLYYFLQARKAPYLPATIAPLLDGIARGLDPALTDPDTEVPLSKASSKRLRLLDSRFSRSVRAGLEFVQKYRFLSAPELDLLRRLAKLDYDLSMPKLRRARPAAASRVQRLLRDFSSRLVRRSVGARSASVLDASVLRAFQEIVEDRSGNGDPLYDAAGHVQRLLNKGEYFEVSLTTTFGQPLPPLARQATLVVAKRKVKPSPTASEGRPHPPIRFLEVGSGKSAQPVALTYDLFRAVTELDRGMSVASLPKGVVALLDATRATLSGPIVRDQDVLDDAYIRLGASGTLVQQRRGGFGASKERKRT